MRKNKNSHTHTSNYLSKRLDNRDFFTSDRFSDKNNQENNLDTYKQTYQQLIPFEEYTSHTHIRWEHLSKILQNSERFFKQLLAPIHILETGLQYYENIIKRHELDKKMLDVMFNEINNLNNLVSYFRLSFIHEITFVETDITDIIHREISSLRSKFRAKKISIRLESNNLQSTYCCAEFLSYCIRNILRNALNYAQSRSELTIQDQIIIHESNKYLKLEFIHPVEHFNVENLQKSCTPFYSSDPSRTGMGLSLCQEIILLMNGHFAIDGLSGPSVRTTITLPV